MAFAAEILDNETSHPLMAGIAGKYAASPLIRDAVLSSLGGREFAFLQNLWKIPDWQASEPGKEILLEMLATSVVRKGEAAELTALLGMLEGNGNALGWREKAVLTGLSIGGGGGKTKPVVLTSAPAILTASGSGIEPSRRQALASLFTWPGNEAVGNSAPKKNPLGEEEQKLFALGRQHYLTTCAGCHGTDGAGLSRFAPPLAGSDWVLGDPKRLALIVLHGMEGPVAVNGKVYDAPEILPVMPAHSTMDDATITAILIYIRNEWGNDAGPVGKRTVGTTRLTSQGRVVPWKAEELNNQASSQK